MSAAPRSPARRHLLKGAVLSIGFSLGPAFGQATAPARLPGSLNGNRMLDAWLAINADGSVVIKTGKVELGQGILTALVQIAADELDVAPQRVRVVSGDTALTPNEGVTSGSLSIQQSGRALRHVCAEVRRIFLERASDRLGTGIDALDIYRNQAGHQ